MKTAHKRPTNRERPENRFRIEFKTPTAKQAHIELVTGTNKVGPSRVRIGPLKF